MHAEYDEPGPIIRTLLNLALLSGILAIIFSVGVLWYQVAYWLEFGQWRSLTLGDVWVWLKGQPLAPKFSWLGVQKIAELTLEISMPLGVAVAGGALIFGSTRVGVVFCAFLFPTTVMILLFSYLIRHFI